MDSHRLEPFRIAIERDVLEDLRIRLARTQWPGQVRGTDWTRGPDEGFMRALARRWEAYDWPGIERRLNELPQFRASIDGIEIHFVHVRSGAAHPMPLLLCHGWPSTFYEFVKLVPLLADGADDAELGFDLVIPSLPGYGFSDRLQPPSTFNRVPELLVRLMTEVLRYPRFACHGGDIGAMVANRLAIEFPDSLLGLHVTFPPEPAFGPGTPEATPEERRILQRRPTDFYWQGGYVHFAATRPQTLAYALADSPIGLAAWLVDKLREWTDCDGDLATRFTDDELLTWISLYWLTGTAGSSLDPYWDWALGSAGIPAAWDGRDVPAGVDSRPLAAEEQIAVPAAVAVMERGAVNLPRKWAERSYADLRRWSVLPRGGHFAAWEEPELLADDLQAFLAPLRASPA